MEEQNKKPQTTHGSEQNEEHNPKLITVKCNEKGCHVIAHGVKSYERTYNNSCR
ncbi:hypothetical protein [Staphylococcus chromogenes]|uniref:hypothetical protein n=1 Tax=Staphylococcus chromogenes TaxID=46126 RepID=UPI00145E71D4|nr:hypothetical protein [Staphylococcus chromogenes]